MSYKTILVHTGLGKAAADRIRLACGLARAADAHLIGSALTGISRFIPAPVIAGGGPALAACCAAMRRDAAESLQHFSRLVQEEAVASSETRLIDDDVDGGMAVQARYCDLVVVGQSDDSLLDPRMPGNLPAYLLLNCGRPVLVVPYIGCKPDLDGEALLAWDGSIESTRAVAGALPLLQAARRVAVTAFDDRHDYSKAEEDPCAAMAQYLRRHGIAAHVSRREGQRGVAEAILAEAADTQSCLLVMGGYGQSHFRELVLGGVTETVLRSMTLPTLLAH
jgi:nucleotide-binding universal stress UspA family protein